MMMSMAGKMILVSQDSVVKFRVVVIKNVGSGLESVLLSRRSFYAAFQQQ